MTDNDGDTIAAGTAFTIGHADNQVAPHIGDTVSLVAGSGAVRVDFADFNNQQMPAGSSVSVVAGTGGCIIANSPGFTLGSGNSTAVSSVFINLTEDTTTGAGSSSITVSVIVPDSGTTSTFSFSCNQ